MTLAEAFMERKDIQKKIDRAKEELNSVLITEEGQNVTYTAKDKEEEVVKLMDDLLNLNIKIEKANEENREDLQNLRSLDREIIFYSNLRSSIIHGETRRRIYKGFDSSDTSIKLIKNIDEIYLANKLEKLEQIRRDLDRKLQRKNWSIEI